MKKLLTIAALILTTAQSYGAEVRSARLDASKKNILVDVVHGGGCGKHEFSLKIGRCSKSMPAQCSAQLIHKTNDTCEGLIGNTIVISLKDSGLNKSQFSKASLRITGDKDWETNELSSAVVELP